MSKTIVIFGFHAIQAQLDSAPEGFVKVLTLDNRNDKRVAQITSQLNQLEIFKPLNLISNSLIS